MRNENGEGNGISFVIMPIEILQDKSLTSSEKILYCYLTLFKSGVCFQSNDKLSEMTGLDESTVKRGLKKLAEMKYIYVEFVNNNSAMRRLYVVLDNPKKLAYLSRKGMFSLDKEDRTEPDQEHASEPIPHKPIVDIANIEARPRRGDFKTDKEYEKAFYKWNTK